MSSIEDSFLHRCSSRDEVIVIGSPFDGITTKFIVDPGGQPGGDSELAKYRVFPGNEQTKA